MVTKLAFINKCNKALIAAGFQEAGADATVQVMAKLTLKDTEDAATVPEDLVGKCVDTLKERVKMMKGDVAVGTFEEAIK